MAEEKFLYQINKQELENNQISFERPTILGAYQKVDGEMRICEKLKYLIFPELTSYPLHINTKIEKDQEKDEADASSGLNRRVYELYIREKDLCNKSSSPVDHIKLFTQRRVLTNIFAAPYSSTEVKIFAKRHGNMIFMTMEQPIESEYVKDVNVFSLICERDFPNRQSNCGTLVNHCETGGENELGYMIFGTKVDNFDIVYSNRATPVLSEETIENVANTDVLNNCNFVLTKLINERKEKYWMKTVAVLKFWNQCFLSAIQNIFVGLVDDQCVVRKPAKLYKVDQIKEAQRMKINVCQAFLCKFLKLLEETTTAGDPWDTVYNINFDGQGNITYSIEKRSPESIIFSAEFAEYMRNQ